LWQRFSAPRAASACATATFARSRTCENC